MLQIKIHDWGYLRLQLWQPAMATSLHKSKVWKYQILKIQLCNEQIKSKWNKIPSQSKIQLYLTKQNHLHKLIKKYFNQKGENIGS